MFCVVVFSFSRSLLLMSVAFVTGKKIGSSGSNSSSSRCQLQMQLLFHFKCACACNPSCVFARLRPLCCFSLQERERTTSSQTNSRLNPIGCKANFLLFFSSQLCSAFQPSYLAKSFGTVVFGCCCCCCCRPYFPFLSCCCCCFGDAISDAGSS